ncbi:MAG TPA: phosphohistidine phosphatase SixA [Chthoniobacterales bacterium]|nr:phosphohistidine phosphatase SixA [Chthoniobacterales bacterium]
MAKSKVDLFFLRHGLADWPNWKGSDDDRPLTDEGREETHRVASFLAALGVRPRKILTSPLPRAAQTADIAAKHLRVPIETAKSLAKGFDVDALKRTLTDDKIDSVMLVGHEPDFSRVIAKLTGGDVKLKKTGVARLDLDRRTMTARLRWLLTPAICQKVGAK